MLNWIENYNLVIFDNIDSTNQEAKRLISSGVKENCVLWAHNQTAGVGRNGSTWFSGEDNLYFSILINFHKNLEYATQIPILVGVVLLEAINSLHKIDLKLKWPNDLMFEENKVAGILVEAITEKDSTKIIIGLGVNVKTSPIILAKNVTSLQNIGINVSKDELMNAFMKLFQIYYNVWHIDGFDDIKIKWLKYAYKIFDKVKLRDSDLIGSFEGIDDSGAMLVKINSDIIKYTNPVLFFEN